MTTNRRLVEQTITQDLFGPDGLTEPAEINVPEKYELHECLGRGGFGVVYRAVDKVLNRPVALKFLHNARPADLERFRREARFAARLNNPSIVQIYELGESDGQPFIAMQFVNGRNLAEAALQPEALVRALRTVVAALEHAHREGIVHRDLKPANILVDTEGRSFLTDFGIARDISGDSEIGTLSMHGALIGTPALMAPEQARGDLNAVDARTDIYALGATMYQLFCGCYPFTRPTVVDLLHAVIHDEVPRPRSVNPELPVELEEIIIRCMQKERSKRFSGMREIGDLLDAHMAGRLPQALPARWPGWRAGPTPTSPSDAANLHETVGMEVARELAAWDANLYRVSRNIERLHPQLESIIDRLNRVLTDHPHLAWARFYRGVAHLRRGNASKALDDMERSIDRMSNQAAAQFEMGRLYLNLYLQQQKEAHHHLSPMGMRGHLADSKGRLKQAVVCFVEATRLRSDLQAWQIHYARAAERFAVLDYSGCVAECDKIIEDDPDVEEVWKLRGDALRFAGNDPFESYDQAIAIRRSYHEAHLAKAETCLERQLIEEAITALKRALEVRPSDVEAVAQLARCCLLEARRDAAAGNTAAAAGHIQTGLASIADVLPRQAENFSLHITRAELLAELAAMEQSAERYDEALATLQIAATLRGCQNKVICLKTQCQLRQTILKFRQDQCDRAASEQLLRRVLGSAREMMAIDPTGTAWFDLEKETLNAARDNGLSCEQETTIG